MSINTVLYNSNKEKCYLKTPTSKNNTIIGNNNNVADTHINYLISSEGISCTMSARATEYTPGHYSEQPEQNQIRKTFLIPKFVLLRIELTVHSTNR